MKIGEAISILTEHLKDKGAQQVEVVDEPLRGTAWGEKIFRFTKTHDTKGKGEELFCPRFKLRDVGQSLAQLVIDLEANRKITDAKVCISIRQDPRLGEGFSFLTSACDSTTRVRCITVKKNGAIEDATFPLTTKPNQQK